jgi:hypothetical protein
LVVTKRRGREKLHFLNPVPIRLVHDRWVSKYAEPWAAALSGLKKTIEEDGMEKVFEVCVRATPERLWEAITGETVEEEPPRRLVETMKAHWSPLWRAARLRRSRGRSTRGARCVRCA